MPNSKASLILPLAGNRPKRFTVLSTTLYYLQKKIVDKKKAQLSGVASPPCTWGQFQPSHCPQRVCCPSFPPLPPRCPLDLPPTYPGPAWSGQGAGRNRIAVASVWPGGACSGAGCFPCSSGCTCLPVHAFYAPFFPDGWGEEVMRGTSPVPLSFHPPGKEGGM